MDTKSSYTSAYDVTAMPDKIDSSGSSPRSRLEDENKHQRVVADNRIWLLAREIEGGADSKKYLKRVGLNPTGPHSNPLFYTIYKPTGWTKSTIGAYTKVFDNGHKLILMQYFAKSICENTAYITVEDQPKTKIRKIIEFVGDIL